ncbi:HU family DNA-binding protein [Lutibacter sp.]
MIKYKIINKINPQDVNAVQKFYAIKQAQETLTLRDFGRRISRESTVSMMDTMAVLEGLLQIIPDELINGKIIKLGDFGTFRTTLATEGTLTEEAFTVANIKKLNIRFRPDREFVNKLAGVEYSKVS